MRHLPTRCTRSPTFGLATERGSMCVHCARFGGATRQHVCILRTHWWCYAAACVYTAHALVVLQGSMCVYCARYGATRQHLCTLRTLWCYAAACVYTVRLGATRQHVCTLRTLWCYAAACVYTVRLGATRQHVCTRRTLWCYAAACVYTAHVLVLRRGNQCPDDPGPFLLLLLRNIHSVTTVHYVCYCFAIM